MNVNQAWDDYEHLNYAEEPDMDHVERAFKAGFEAGYEEGAGDTMEEMNERLG